jgi:hypothetical protein
MCEVTGIATSVTEFADGVQRRLEEFDRHLNGGLTSSSGLIFEIPPTTIKEVQTFLEKKLKEYALRYPLLNLATAAFLTGMDFAQYDMNKGVMDDLKGIID